MFSALAKAVNGVVTGTLFDKAPTTDEEKRQAVAKMFSKYKGMAFAQVESISSAELQRKLADQPGKVVVVDCRPPAERVSSIAGAVQQDEFDADAVEEGAEVVVFCTVGYRSGVFGKKLQEKYPGLTVRNLEGGILSWCHEQGTQVVDPVSNAPTKTVHVYGKTWNLLPEAYEAVIGEPGKLTKL